MRVTFWKQWYKWIVNFKKQNIFIMRNLVKVGIFAFAIGLFATACNSTGNQGNSNADSSAAIEQEAPVTAPAPADTAMMAPADSAAADSSTM